MMKVVALSILTASLAFANTQCELKLKELNKELEFAKLHKNEAQSKKLEFVIKQIQEDCASDPLFYDKKAQNKLEKEQRLKALEIQLKVLENNKSMMSKNEYKAQKQKLKDEKDEIKKAFEGL
ncbi:DUF1090 domain-containing protein [Campylobacter sp. MIT 12-8780]|uniref:DUF1090 family protein n=1 Tax=unclassified Campylobacter TaxID=2593542 RepID=UPI0010F767A8|nr:MULTISPECIES: DUF1090 family protein [unclassified Campylobacter]NDJ27609.1 DUF1090 family protein [Campylobacter sp. MIT 19-121]TKX29825.1 DUF1090 domain-containing protein [Campylobacter sp. MIT 12-5580]TQR40780.1 DUF1090 domain-containing protein [Campylobacter sp. MIT 12-8780]